VRRYSIPEGYRASVDKKVQEWIDDGLVEWKNKEVSRLLKKCMKGSTNQWHKWLPVVQLCLNLKTLHRTGSRPFDLFFGRPFNSFHDFTQIKNIEDIESAINHRLENLIELRDVVWPSVAIKTKINRKNKAEWTNNHLKQLPNLMPGAKVMALDQTRSSKWDPVYEGPYTIIRKTGGGAYILQDHDGTTLDRKMTISMLKPIDGMIPSGGRKQQDKDSKHYEIAGILDHRQKKNGKGYEYRVRWKDFKESEDTWEPEENFDDVAIIKRYWNQRKKGKIELPRARGRPKKSV
jgi:hypothetical protein